MLVIFKDDSNADISYPTQSGVFEACNYVMLFLRYTLCFNSVLSYFFLIQFGFDDGIDVAILP